jgi:hypothetical protein
MTGVAGGCVSHDIARNPRLIYRAPAQPHTGPP